MFGYFFVLATICAVANGQFLNCNWVNNLNCATYTPGEICGTDGKTYNNRCYLAKAQCADKNLRTKEDGPCKGSTATAATSGPIVTSTAAPMVTNGVTNGVTSMAGSTTTRESIFNNHNELLDFFCLELMHETCPNDTEKVCGTDGVTYANFCEYEKQRCGHRTLQVKNFGDC